MPCSPNERLYPSTTAPPNVHQWYNTTTCILYISGTASLLEFRNVLSGIRYRNTADEPQAVNRSAVFRVYDESLVSLDATTEIIIQFVNDPPRIVLNGTLFVISLTYKEGTGNLTLAPNALVQDDDSSTLSNVSLSLTVASGSSYVPLGFSASEYLSHPQLGQTVNGISVSAESQGVLLFSGVASLLEYQAIIRLAFYFRAGEIPLVNNTERQVSRRVMLTDIDIILVLLPGTLHWFGWVGQQ